jgi:hypothetical protein
MTIAEMRERSNMALSRVPKDLLVVGIVLLFSSASFGLGILAGRDMGKGGAGKDGFWIENLATTSAARLPAAAEAAQTQPAQEQIALPVAAAGAAIAPTEGKYVASKSGTKYYLPTCSGAKRIKEENKVWFATVADATAAGLTPAANCPGL